MKRSFLSFLLLLSILLSALPVMAMEASLPEDVIEWKQQSLSAEGAPLLRTLSDKAGTAGADWYAIALARLGFADDYTAYRAMLEAKIEETLAEGAEKALASDLQRMALTLLAVGGDPSAVNVKGEAVDLVALSTYERSETAPLGKQGVNGYLWALILLSAADREIPAGSAETLDTILTAVLENQLENGSFTLNGLDYETDLTAMAVIALAPYQERTVTLASGPVKVADRMELAIDYLATTQQADGRCGSWDKYTAETTAQVIIALCSAGINPNTDPRFIKEGKTLWDGLMLFRTGKGGFAHSLNAMADSMASAQTLLAIAAQVRYEKTMPALYDLSADGKTPVNLFTGEKLSFSVTFGKEGKAAYEAIPKTVTTAHYSEVLRLLAILEGATDGDNYSELKVDLQRMKAEIEAIQAEIAALDAAILALPVDPADCDADAVFALMERAAKLSSYDRGQLKNYDILEQTSATIHRTARMETVRNLVLIAIVLLVILLVLRVLLRKSKKKSTAFAD